MWLADYVVTLAQANICGGDEDAILHRLYFPRGLVYLARIHRGEGLWVVHPLPGGPAVTDERVSRILDAELAEPEDGMFL